MLAALPMRQSQTCHSPSLRCCLLLTKHSFLQVTCCPIVRHSLQPTGSEACQGQRRCMLYRQHLLDDALLGDAKTAFSSAAVILKKPHKYILAGPWCNRRSFCCPVPEHSVPVDDALCVMQWGCHRCANASGAERSRADAGAAQGTGLCSHAAAQP